MEATKRIGRNDSGLNQQVNFIINMPEKAASPQDWIDSLPQTLSIPVGNRDVPIWNTSDTSKEGD
jgi:hypothetical protein